jgi:hypothetical protein
MLAFQTTALALAAAILFWMYSGDFGADVALAVVACLS